MFHEFLYQNKRILEKGKVDWNDFEFALKRWGVPEGMIAAPLGGKNMINPHVSKFFYGNMRGYIFHVKPVYYFSGRHEWRPLDEIASYYGNKRGMTLLPGWEQKIHFEYLVWYMKRLEMLKGWGVRLEYPISYLGKKIDSFTRPLVMNPTYSFFPDPDPETTSVDGYVQRLNSGDTFTQIDTGAGTGSGDANAQQELELVAITTTDQYNYFTKDIFLFNSASIVDSETVDAATLDLFAAGAPITNLGDLNVNVYLSTPASNIALVAGDYNQIGTVTQATNKATSTFTNAQYNSLTLDATGRGNVNKTGLTKFAIDFSTDPTWASGARTNITFKMAETAGTANDPRLAVTTSAAASAGGMLTLLGVG